MKVPDKLWSWLPCLFFSVLMIALVVLGFRKQVDNPAGSDLVVFLHAGRLMPDGVDPYLVPVLTTTTQKHYFVLIIPAVVYVVFAWLVFNFRDAAFRWLVAAAIGRSLNAPASRDATKGTRNVP